MPIRWDRTYAASLLFAAHILAYADRQVVNVLLPAFRDSLHLSLVQASLIQGLAFSLIFALAGVPLGRLTDSRSRRNLLAMGIALWSVATVGCGLANSFWQLFVARMCVGIGEACLIPATASLLADYYSPDNRGRAVNFVQAGAPVGSFVAIAGGGWMLSWLADSGVLARLGVPIENWQAVFLTLGGPGLILAALLLGMQEPARRQTVLPTTRGSIGVLQVFGRNPVVFLGFIVLYSLMAMENYMLAGWAPTILMTTHGLSAGSAGAILGTVTLICGFGAYFASGVSSDLLMRWRPQYGRIFTPVVALPLCLVGFAWLYLARDVLSTTLALGFALFWGALVSAGAVPALQQMIPHQARGRSFGIIYTIKNLIGLGAGPTLVALVAEYNGGASGLQQSLAGVCMVAVALALLVWFVFFRSYANARNYEAEEFAAEQAAEAPDNSPRATVTSKA